jgi:hypothetical protein
MRTYPPVRELGIANFFLFLDVFFHLPYTVSNKTVGVNIF